jgi:hypothetical protein
LCESKALQMVPGTLREDVMAACIVGTKRQDSRRCKIFFYTDYNLRWIGLVLDYAGPPNCLQRRPQGVFTNISFLNFEETRNARPTHLRECYIFMIKACPTPGTQGGEQRMKWAATITLRRLCQCNTHRRLRPSEILVSWSRFCEISKTT